MLLSTQSLCPPSPLSLSLSPPPPRRARAPPFLELIMCISILVVYNHISPIFKKYYIDGFQDKS